jgi:GT2 family glycosyltransferase
MPLKKLSITTVVVVVPVRNEEDRVSDCLTAIAHAIRRIRTHPVREGAEGVWPVPRVQTLAVLDACTDGSADAVARHPWVRSTVSAAGRVGAARALGVSAGLRACGTAPEQTWIATTDADSLVSADWLAHQLDLAQDGADVFCGLVDPDIRECGPARYSAWRAEYQPGEGHPHVHGANLGIRADAYLACGGFDPSLSAHEDVELVRTAQRRGLTAASGLGVVSTSGRTIGRVGGESFAQYLDDCQVPTRLLGGDTVSAT